MAGGQTIGDRVVAHDMPFAGRFLCKDNELVRLKHRLVREHLLPFIIIHGDTVFVVNITVIFLRDGNRTASGISLAFFANDRDMSRCGESAQAIVVSQDGNLFFLLLQLVCEADSLVFMFALVVVR